jgi:hypothetical protein
MAGGAGGRIPASSPPLLAGEVAGEELRSVIGRFEPELKVGKTGSERNRRRWTTVSIVAGHPAKGRRVQCNARLG